MHFIKPALLICLISLLSEVHCQTLKLKPNETVLGVFESLDNLLLMHKSRFAKITSLLKEKTKDLTQDQSIKEVIIDPYFMRSILLYSDQRYLDLIEHDECQFYSLLDSNLLKAAGGPITKVIVAFMNADSNEQVAIVSKQDFLKFIYTRKCFKNREISLLFNLKNIKETIEAIDFVIPEDTLSCKKIFNRWRNNPYLTGLCKIPETIRFGKTALKKILKLESTRSKLYRYLDLQVRNKTEMEKLIPPSVKAYLGNLCNNIDNEKKFCEKYLIDDIWKKVIDSNYPKYLMKFKCRDLLKKNHSKKLTQKDLRRCRSIFMNKPNICKTIGAKDRLALFPRPDCNEISEALINAQLVTDYHDCPGSIDNEGITNSHRVIMHLKPRATDNTPKGCATEVNFTFATLNINFKNNKAWPLKICYYHQANDETLCFPYIPGHNPKSKLSETWVVANIVKKLKAAPDSLKCHFMRDSEYNPQRLNHKHGCFITFNKFDCTNIHCPKKIYYNQLQIKALKYSGIPTSTYFHHTIKAQRNSTANIMSKTYNFSNKIVRNLPAILRFLDQDKKHVIHGMGCAEDIYPQYFKKTLINDCTSLPFIIDGHMKKDGNTYLITRTALDDIHSPRFIDWHLIFAAVSAHTVIQPLKTWTLYGIKK
ncbi:MAG: hypothetical protein ISR65_03740 [Bacteriovoracaceae bacterium]|nr:hypothetical protein [Bacteriovoracaceae bacterium]